MMLLTVDAITLVVAVVSTAVAVQACLRARASPHAQA
jgi:hypothetical protein